MRFNYNLILGGSLVAASMTTSAFVVRQSAGTFLRTSISPGTTQQVTFRSLHPIKNQPFTNLSMGFLSDLFQAPKVSSQSQIIQAFRNPKTVVVDVRSPSEISSRVDARNWINAPGTPFDCPSLRTQASTLLPDKSAPVIVYCASGKRSQKAADILIELGYQNVLNGGGIGHLTYLPIK